MKTNHTILAVFILTTALHNVLLAVYPRAGYVAELSTLQHDVSGTVTIVDDNTIVVENFKYDGTAPAVYFYLGKEHTDPSFNTGQVIGQQLTRAYDDENLVLSLTGSLKLDDYTAISVWCEAFSVNFGSGSFIDPAPAVAWTFGNIGLQDYTLDDFTPADAPFGTIGAADPTLTLYAGKRYQVTVTNFGSHPFEVIAKGATAGGDTVLLSAKSGTTGSLENDPDIVWQDDGSGTVSFTVTPELVAAMTAPGQRPGYRCGFHTATMRGDFNICTAELASDLNGDCKNDLLDLKIAAADWLDTNIIP